MMRSHFDDPHLDPSPHTFMSAEALMNKAQSIRLSKQQLLSGHRCVRKLWIESLHEPATSGSDDEGARIARRERWVLEAARSRFRSGELMKGDQEQRIKETAAALDRGARVLFGASFEHRGLSVTTNVIKRRRAGGHMLTEVRSSTWWSDSYLLDLAVQVYVLRGAGLDVQQAEVMRLNRNSRHPDLDRLFVRHNVTDRVKALVPSVPRIMRRVRVGIARDDDHANIDSTTWITRPTTTPSTSSWRSRN
jgi:hypothetical protein